MRKSTHYVAYLLLAALSMGYGWGWRGDYGHEVGAMLPGALVAMAVCLASGRRDWWDRCLVFALFAAIGWGFGGSQSYGIVLGYTLHNKFWGVAYGFACLFVIGALWGAIGGGFLGMAATLPRSRLNRFIGPLVAVGVVWAALDWNGLTAWSEEWTWLVDYDVDWLAALSAFVVAGAYALALRSDEAKLLSLLALGWWAGFVVLTLGLHLRMTPPRSDNWAGIVGVCVVLWGYLTVNRHRAARAVLAYGGLSGGLGFSVAALWLTLSSTYGWSVGGWRLMEQTFGLVMGFGIGLVFLRLASRNLAPAQEDARTHPLNVMALLVLFPGVLGLNFQKNIDTWLQYAEAKTGTVYTLSQRVFGMSVEVWFGSVVVLATLLLVWAVWRHRRAPLSLVPAHPLGRSQLVYLVLLWCSIGMAFAQKIPRLAHAGAFFSQYTFGILALACTALVLGTPSSEVALADVKMESDRRWRPAWPYWLVLAAVPLVILVLAFAAVKVHPEALPNSHYRFEHTRLE